jgi:hypothetical protein
MIDLGLALAHEAPGRDFAVDRLDDPCHELQLDVSGRAANALESFARSSFLPIWLRSGPTQVPSPGEPGGWFSGDCAVIW